MVGGVFNPICQTHNPVNLNKFAFMRNAVVNCLEEMFVYVQLVLSQHTIVG